MRNNVATIDERILNVKEKFNDQIPIEDVSKVVSEVMDSIAGDVPVETLQLKDELKELLSYIDQAKGEIAALRPKEYSANKIPEASNELDAIVQGTEAAAEKIMDCADELGELAEQCDADMNMKLVTISTNLFEASGFQDITGQRVSKVVATLSHLEDKLSALAHAIGDNDIDETNDVEGGEAKDYEAMSNEDFLNGPQLEEEAQDQAAIDALFDDF